MAEKFLLKIVGADEDVPRLLLAYGRACGGEMAFVMRPREDRGVLVHQVKKQRARIWRTVSGQAPTHAPEEEIEPTVAVAEVTRMKSSPPPAGPATLRGAWTGVLYCTDGRPSMVLARKVASYGTLKLASGADGRWTATFERAPRWFSKAAQESVQRDGLAEAIQAGMGLVVGLVSEACSFRDTRRRNAVDAEYAVAHPYQPHRAPKDPTERYRPKPGPAYRLRQDDAGFDVLDAAGNVVARFGAREKGKAEKHLRALNKGQLPAVTVSVDVASAFGMGGLPGVTVVPALDALPTPEPPTGPTSAARIAAATEKEAEALAELALSSWGASDAPELLRRAGRLIKHAQALAASPLCTGKEQRSALEDIRRAAGAYQQAADAIGRGESPDVVTTLRRISERVSLAAARAAKSCAAGQQKLGLERPPPVFPRGNSEAKPARGRKAKTPEVDPAKDKALVDAFAQAIQAAAAQMGAA